MGLLGMVILVGTWLIECPGWMIHPWEYEVLPPPTWWLLGSAPDWAPCIEGPGADACPGCVDRWDFLADQDGDVDLADFAVYQNLLTKPYPACGTGFVGDDDTDPEWRHLLDKGQ